MAGLKLCVNCGREMTITGNNQKFCLDCRKARRKEKFKGYNKNRSEESKQHQKVLAKGWRNRNKDKVREAIKRYNKRNPFKVNVRKRTYEQVKIPIGQLCQICNKSLAVERHHIDYNDRKNVLLLCESCHTRVTQNPLFNENRFKKACLS